MKVYPLASYKQDIFKLTQQLASQSSFENKIELLKNFIEIHFLCNLRVHFFDNIPQKSIKENLHELSVIDTVSKSDDYTNLPVEDENKSIISLPILINDQPIGYQVFEKQEGKFIDDEISELKNLNLIASLSYQSSILQEGHNIQDKQLKLVQNVSKQLVNITDLDHLFRKICDLILSTFNYYYVGLFTLDSGSENLTFRASARAEDSSQPLFEYFPGSKIKVGDHIVGYVAKSGLHVVANDVNQEPRYGHLETLSKTESEVALPLLIDGQTIGVLDIQSEKENAFSEDDIHLLKTLADNIAIAVHRVKLYDVVKRRNDQLDAIEEVSQAITFILDLDELLEKVVLLLHQKFNYPYVHIFLTQPAENQIAFKTGSGSRALSFKESQVRYNLNSEKGIIVTAYKKRKTIFVNDVTTDENFIPNPITKNYLGSELAIPLIFGEQVLGVLDIQSELTNAFSDYDQDLLNTLGANVAIAIRNARLYHSESWRRQVAESLKDVAITLTDNKSLDLLFNTILDKIIQLLPLDVVSFWIRDDNNQFIENEKKPAYKFKSFLTSTAINPNKLQSIDYSNGCWFEKADNDEIPMIHDKSLGSDPISRALEFPDDYSAIAAPLKTGDQLLGVLLLHHHSAGRYGHESQNITSSFASYAAVSMENTRLFETSQEQAWISTVLLQVAQATQSLSTIQELVATVVRLTPLLVGVEGCALFLRESESLLFMMHALFGSAFNEQLNKLPLPVPNANLFDKLMKDQTPLIVTNPEFDLDLPDSMFTDLDKKILIMLPLITHNELLGGFLLVQSTNEFPQNAILDDKRLAIIQGITQQTATAVENIRLFDAKQEEAYVSAALFQVAQAVVSSESLHDTLESIVHIIPILAGIDCSIVYLFDHISKRFFPSHIYCRNQSINVSDLFETSYVEGEFPILDAVKTNNTPLAHPTLTTLSPDDWDLAIPVENILDEKLVLNSPSGILMGFPLSVKGEIYGVLICQEEKFNPNRERRFDLLHGIAQQASMAIQNYHLNQERADRERMDREFQVAREIQRTFLPETLPVIDGYEASVYWHTARQVGGDFYDIFRLEEKKYGIVIADVSDKGLAAALYMTVTRTLLRSSAIEFSSTAKTLERVNDLLLLNSQNGLFVTIFYAILDAESSTLHYTNAGHNRPFLLRASEGKLVELKGGGIAIGAIPSIKLPEYDIKLDSGDCLIMHTDGVTETFDSEGDMYGENRYKKVLKKGFSSSSQELMESIERDLDNFRRGAPLSDDVTLLAVKRSVTRKSELEY